MDTTHRETVPSPETWVSRIGIGPFALGLGLFVLFGCVVLNVALYLAFGSLTSLHLAQDILRWNAGDDSWTPMRVALAVLRMESHSPLYTTSFFEWHAKFQYPLTGLLIFDPLYRLTPDETVWIRVLNATSWITVVATMILAVVIFLRRVEADLPAAAPRTPLDRLVLAAAAGLGALAFHPVTEAFSLGQVQTWNNLLFCAAVMAFMNGRKGLAGAVTAAICIIKPPLMLFVLWGAIRREWHFLLWLVGCFGAALVLSLLAYQWQDHVDYVEFLSYISGRGESFFANQSVNGLLNRMLGNGPNVVWSTDSFPPYNIVVHVGTVVSSAVIVGIALFWRSAEAARVPLADFLVAGLSFTMASPIAWTHHYGVLLPMFAVALPATLACRRFGTGSVVLLAAAYLLTASYLDVANRLADTPFNFIQSYVFFGAALLLVQLYRLRHAQGRADSPLPSSAA